MRLKFASFLLLLFAGGMHAADQRRMIRVDSISRMNKGDYWVQASTIVFELGQQRISYALSCPAGLEIGKVYSVLPIHDPKIGNVLALLDFPVGDDRYHTCDIESEQIAKP